MTDYDKTPITIDGVGGKVAVLERRVDYLRRKLEKADYASTTSADFDRAELGALRAAIKALKFHSLTHDARLDPVSMLKDLMETYDDGSDRPVLKLGRDVLAALAL